MLKPAIYRPSLHFSAPDGWINDPNGLVYVDGTYHLFYQFYPEHYHWGPMHWGHAVSTDLIRWEDLGVALYPDGDGWMFSGSACLDTENRSGFGSEGKPAMVLAYTCHDRETRRETQCVAYSTDYTAFTKYEGNPVIPGQAGVNSRDPKLFWNPVRNCWSMALATEESVSFYATKDLVRFEKTGSFRAGDHGLSGTCECPDLFPVETPEGTRWVLIVSMVVPERKEGEPVRTGNRTRHVTQYYVGTFDGDTFTDTESAGEALFLDYGPDFYAPVTFNGLQKPVLIGWADNWEYAGKSPCEREHFQGKMTFARELSLVRTPDGYRAVTRPVVPEAVFGEEERIPADGALSFEGPVQVTVKRPACGEIRFGNEAGEYLSVSFAEGKITVDRDHLDVRGFHEGFDEERLRKIDAPWLAEGEIRMVLDGCLLEVYADGGRTCITCNAYAKNALAQVETRGQLEATAAPVRQDRGRKE